MKEHSKKSVLIILLGGIVLFFVNQCVSGEVKTKVRKPAVAGAFYPSNPSTLRNMIEGLLKKAEVPEIKESVTGLIAPHAGYVYSGGVAAHAYKVLQGRKIERVVVISPSHIDYFSGASIYDGTHYETPLGLIPVDTEFARELATKSERLALSEQGHTINFQGRGEHALEVQLPFLQVVLGDFKLVPIVMGDQSYETARALGRALAALIHDDKTIIVASSDLSHYHPYEEATKLDSKVLNAIKEWDYYNLSRNLQGRIWEACGGGPIISLMIASEYLGANKPMLLKYANSGDVPMGDKSRVVGYSAFVFVKMQDSNQNEEQFSLDKKAQQKLLEIAKKAVELAVEKGEVYNPSPGDIESIKQDRGAFVTLKIGGQLRGCIGYTAPLKPLYLTVRDVAIQAATNDPRFSPVSRAELPHLKYEISVLSPFRHVRDVKEIKIGRDGLLIKKGNHAGLLLPQVPVEWGWDLETFLQQTCRKAGLPPDAWKDDDADLFRFTAFVFGED